MLVWNIKLLAWILKLINDIQPTTKCHTKNGKKCSFSAVHLVIKSKQLNGFASRFQRLITTSTKYMIIMNNYCRISSIAVFYAISKALLFFCTRPFLSHFLQLSPELLTGHCSFIINIKKNPIYSKIRKKLIEYNF